RAGSTSSATRSARAPGCSRSSWTTWTSGSPTLHDEDSRPTRSRPFPGPCARRSTSIRTATGSSSGGRWAQAAGTSQGSSVHGVVGDLLDGDIRPGRWRGLVAHHDDAHRPPAPGLEVAAERLGGVDAIEVQTPVREACERVVREGDEGVDAHRRVVFDANEV